MLAPNSIPEIDLKHQLVAWLRNSWLRLGFALGLVMGGLADCQQAAAQASSAATHWTKRIVGGVAPKGGEYPWMVALVDAGDPSPYRGFLGGATLIHSKWLLTAAHAVVGKQAAEIHAFVGGHSLMDDSEGLRVEVQSIVVHPKFASREGSMGYDVALLELSEPVNDVTLPGLWPLSTDVLVGSVARTMGWGRTATRGFRSTSLLAVDVPVVSAAEVDAVAIYGEPLSPDTLLAGSSEPQRDTCDGDSGGPLVVYDVRLDSYWIAGVVAGGSDRGCAVEGAYGLYTKIGAHRDWLESVVVRSFGDWAQFYQLDGPEQDADGDGFNNFSEYARRSHPLNPNSFPRLASRIGSVDGVRYPEIAGLVRFDIDDVNYDVEWSTDLISWTPVDRLSTANRVAGRLGLFRWMASTPVSDHSLGFFRVREIPLGKAPLLVLNPVPMISETGSQTR